MTRVAGLVRIFFYVNGTPSRDGNLKVVRGSHLHWNPSVAADGDAALRDTWLSGRTHPTTGEPLCIEELVLAPGSVVVMWTHSLHAVNPKPAGSDTRWALITAYRNPHARDASGWMTKRWAAQPTVGLRPEQKQLAAWVRPPVPT
jgi:hypothetical protein